MGERHGISAKDAREIGGYPALRRRANRMAEEAVGIQRVSQGVLDQRVDRRQVLGKAVKLTGGAIVGVIFGGLWGKKAVEDFRAQEISNLEPFEGAKPKKLMTDFWGGNTDIPVRNTPTYGNDDNLLGFAEPGIPVTGLAFPGNVYPSNPESLGRTSYKGGTVGTWYKIEVPVIDKEGKVETVTGFVSGNYLRRPTEVELNSFHWPQNNSIRP